MKRVRFPFFCLSRVVYLFCVFNRNKDMPNLKCYKSGDMAILLSAKAIASEVARTATLVAFQLEIVIDFVSHAEQLRNP